MSVDHAELVCELGEWTLRDAGSRNGVVRNGERIAHTPLVDGDVLEIGHTVFVFAEHEVEPPTVPVLLPTHHPGFASDLAALAKLAPSRVSVMLFGETGSGKEVVARAIHDASGRSGPFVAINCSAIPASLIESELFGYAKGAFTGATESSVGVIRASNGGTLFLDEVAELSPAAQASLLRVLETSEVRPLGSVQALPVDLRTITATHVEPETGRLREDLVARLAGYSVEVPPLRDRRLDLGDITKALLARYAPGATPTLTRNAVRALVAHEWPHNIRGLAKALETALVLGDGGAIDVAHLPPEVRAAVAQSDPRKLGPRETQQRDQLIALLRTHRGNIAAVARELGKATMQIRRWAKKYGIELTDFR
jgi:DNA-binding NtrC family response regulator